MIEDLPAISPVVQHVLDNLAPGDIKHLPTDLGAMVYPRYIRLQSNPYLPYAEAEARWIMLAMKKIEPPAK